MENIPPHPHTFIPKVKLEEAKDDFTSIDKVED